jgi:hypothetical protein
LRNEFPLKRAIFTLDPRLPVELQVIGYDVPLFQVSPPFGEVTVMEGVIVPEVMAKLALLESVIAVVVVLVIRIR